MPHSFCDCFLGPTFNRTQNILRYFLRIEVQLTRAILFLFYGHQDSSDGVRLLSAAVSVFGPRKIIHELFIHNNGMSSTHFSGVEGQDLEARQFMQLFNEIFVPWCLQGNNSSASARLDLLLALIDDEHLSEQWHSVISYSTNLDHPGNVLESMNSESLAMLAKLLDRARGKITHNDSRKVTNTWQKANLGNWHHEHLDSAAVAIAQSHAPLKSSFTDFLWYLNYRSRHFGYI